MTLKASSIIAQDIDHCGIVAGIIDRIGLVDVINEKLGIHPLQRISPGIVVKAMILNGLDLLTAPLYLFEKFFVGKATEHLLGEGIQAEDLNDDRLGRVLDKLYDANLTELFVNIALQAANKEGVKTSSLHLDSTSFHVHGEYAEDEDDSGEPIAIKITQGYSRDHRPDLKQFIVDLMCSGDGDIPLYFRVADGNESDKGIFAKLIREFRENWELDTLFVADAALYGEENLQQLNDLRWLTRVPASLKDAQQLMSQLPDEVFQNSEIEGYSFFSRRSDYAGIEQRWLVVESDSRKESDLKQMNKKIERGSEIAQKRLKRLCQQEFACAPDAEKAASDLEKDLRYHSLSDIEVVKVPIRGKGRPKKGVTPKYRYQLKASLALKADVVEREKNRSGRFILATNVWDSQQLSDDEMLQEYKAQQSTERGFRFLKDPIFFTDSVFIKTPKRVAALAMVMGLCLLVYSLGQRALRQALATAKKSIKNQVGKPTATPTLRWVFQSFQSIHLLIIDGRKQITNLTQERQWILQFLGTDCQKYYLKI